MVVRGGHVARVTELALALLGAAGEQVALEHAGELELAGRGALEPLLRAGMGLYLGHSYVTLGGCVLCPSRFGMTSHFHQFPWSRIFTDLTISCSYGGSTHVPASHFAAAPVICLHCCLQSSGLWHAQA